MTAIAGLVHDGKVYIGGDSAGVAGLRLAVRDDPKVFKVGNDFLVGYTTSFRMGQLLRFYLNPDTPKEGQDGYEYMVCTFIPQVRRVFKDHGYLGRDSDGQEIGGDFLVGWRGSLYAVHSDFQVAKVRTPYFAVGCGQDLVMGSLHTTSNMTKPPAPKKRIEMALDAAEAFSAGVSRPFTVMSK